MRFNELWHAVGQNDVVAVRAALSRPGADLNMRDEEGNTLLHLAAGCEEYSGDSYEEVIEVLLDAGIDINARDGSGATFLLKVVQGHTPDLIQHYLERGADLNIPDDFGITPLVAALCGGEYEPDIETVRVLLEAGADPNLKDRDSQSAMSFAEETAAATGDDSFLKLLRRVVSG